MRMSIRARLALGLAPSLLGLAMVGSIALARIEVVETDERWVAHTHEVLQRATLLGKTIAEAESNARAYRLTGQRPFLDEYRHLRQSWRADLAELRMLVRDHPLQMGRLEQLDAALSRRLHAMDGLVDQAVRTGNGRAPELLQAQSQQLGEDARRVLDAFVQTERALLRERSEQADRTSRLTRRAVTGTAALSFLVTLLMLMAVARSINRPLARLQAGALRVAEGDYESADLPEGDGEIGQVARSFNRMKAEVALRERRLSEQDWINSRLAEFSELFQAPPDLPTLCGRTVSQLARTLSLPYLVLYLRQDGPHGPHLRRCATFAGQGAPERIAAGEGLVGQCLEDGRLLEVHPVPDGHVRITTAAGSSPVAQVLVVPALFEREVKAVLELGLSSRATAAQRQFLERFAQSFGLVLDALSARAELEAALERAMRLSESLQHKQEELTRANAELHQQADQLRASEQLLREQQEQLRRANDECEQANAKLRETAAELAGLNALLAERNRQLADANAELDAFCGAVSHDLRTPLAHIEGFLELLEISAGDKLGPQEHEYVRVMRESMRRMRQLISDFLDFARLGSGDLEMAPVDTHALVASALEEVLPGGGRPEAAAPGPEGGQAPRGDRPAAPEGGAESSSPPSHPNVPRIDIAPLPPAWGDARLLRQVWINLLSNALKYSQTRSPPIIEVRGEVEPERVVYRVRDNGVGFDMQRAQRLFSAFFRMHSGSRFEGVGIGLASVKRIVERHGGTVGAEAAPGQGATFWFALPRRP